MEKLENPCHNCVKLTNEKERLIYWLLRMISDPDIGAADCLADFGYAPSSQRANNMLALGEPGKQ